MPDAQDQGAAQRRVSAALSPAPHHTPLTAQWPVAHQLLQPRVVRASLGPKLRGVCQQPQGEDTGPGPQGGRGVVGAPCACSPPCPAPLKCPLGGAAPRPREADSGSADAAWAPSLRTRVSGMGGVAEEREIGAAVCVSGALGPQV